MSSFLLWFDHELLDKGEAFTNNGSLFYDVNDSYTSTFTYGLPFKQIVSDTSISSAQVLSGVYVNSVFTVPGSGDLIDINYDQGVAFFSADQSSNTLSGDYAVKDFNISFANDKSEEELLFETQYEVQPSVYQEVTGLATNEITIPHIFIKPDGSNNREFAFGGKEQTRTNIRCVVIGLDAFSLDGVESIFVDARGKTFPLLEAEDMPFNYLGGWLSGIAYNHDGVVSANAGNDKIFIDEVFVSKLSLAGLNNELQEINPRSQAMFVDFELTHERTPRA